ncbi:response regulator [Gallaecimonas kandeliae]|uniref:response regulator n=1 Tax=Gallaecimonas kandeliae TaxID=3029055 RepID=UPI002647ED8E|nr:response regulator [Gallaecimonas kandeliae]WKE65762.1 response regulator [Gallaecimonas kandeliae]
MTDRPILLVEDNPDDEFLVLMAFRKSTVQNEILVKRNGLDALDYLHELPQDRQPALMLLDLKLPGMDGLELLRRLRTTARTSTLPVVVLTSSKEDEDLVRSYELGANSFVRKPVDFNDFVEAVRQLGLYWLLLNEQPG